MGVARAMGKAALVAAGLAAGLLAAEVVVRVTGAAPQVGFFQKEQFRLSRNVRIGWEPIPNPDAGGSTLEPRWHPEQRNRMGYRDYEHSLEKVEGICRILVIGDSVVKGFMIPRHEGIYPSVIERKLREAGVRCEVMSFGVEGYNTQQEVETLRDRGLRYDPDLVVLAYLHNDRDWPAHHLYRELLEEELGSGRISATRMAPWLARSALYRFLRFRVLGGGRGEPEGRVRELIDLVQRDTVEEYFGVLAGLSEAEGFEVLVAVFPYLDDLEGDRHLPEHRWVEELSARHGFHHLDLLETFRRCARLSEDPAAIDEVHPSYVGHYCAGHETARHIREEILPTL